jgi:hypothetical protein
MAMGSGGNKKKRGSYFLGRYVPHGGKKISVSYMLELLLMVPLNSQQFI